MQVPERIGGLDLVDSRFVELAHRNDLEVHVWTVNDEAAMRRLLALGVDGLVSDDLPLLRRVLAFRHDG